MAKGSGISSLLPHHAEQTPTQQKAGTRDELPVGHALDDEWRVQPARERASERLAKAGGREWLCLAQLRACVRACVCVLSHLCV